MAEMKTMIVKFESDFEAATSKAYVYLIKKTAKVKVGDILETDDYKNRMHVQRIIDSENRFYNKDTGEITNEYNSTKLMNVKTIDILSKKPDSKKVNAWIVKE